MSRTTWKFDACPEHGWQEVEMPRGAEPIHYDSEGFLWAVVDPEAAVEAQRVGVWGTGWGVPEGARHVHTTISPNGWVWHLFVPEAPDG